MYRIIAKFEGYDVVEHVKMEEYKRLKLKGGINHA